MSFHCPNRYRVASPYGLGDEHNGWFVIPLKHGQSVRVIAAMGCGKDFMGFVSECHTTQLRRVIDCR